jgi:hypothetical protein
MTSAMREGERPRIVKTLHHGWLGAIVRMVIPRELRCGTVSGGANSATSQRYSRSFGRAGGDESVCMSLHVPRAA